MFNLEVERGRTSCYGGIRFCFNCLPGGVVRALDHLPEHMMIKLKYHEDSISGCRSKSPATLLQSQCTDPFEVAASSNNGSSPHAKSTFLPCPLQVALFFNTMLLLVTLLN